LSTVNYQLYWGIVVSFTGGLLFGGFVIVLLMVPNWGSAVPGTDWVGKFGDYQPSAVSSGVCAKSRVGLPKFSVTPAALGKQIVRVSLPFPARALPEDSGVVVRSGKSEIVPDLRILTYHPGKPRCVRRAIVTFVFEFTNMKSRQFVLALTPGKVNKAVGTDTRIGDLTIHITDSSVQVIRSYKELWNAELIAPPLKSTSTPVLETVEHGRNYLWLKLLVPDETWPRIIEVRADSLGTVAVKAHIQRLEAEDGYAPDLGWKINGLQAKSVKSAEQELKVTQEPIIHSFVTGNAAYISTGTSRVSFPDAPMLRRGEITVTTSDITYMRSHTADKIPHQEAAWRTSEFVVGPLAAAPLNVLLEQSHKINIPAKYFDAIYGSGKEQNVSKWPILAGLSVYHRDVISDSAMRGDDYGNVTANPPNPFGMNRLNHCPPFIMEYYRTGDARLRETAIEWCDNFYDLSIWWGTKNEGEFGGTRYNNAAAIGITHTDNPNFMWRSNSAVTFCTKGFDTFFFAYEETGDPRMANALRWQLDYTRHMVHAGLNYCRCVGDVSDFLTLYNYTGDKTYINDALRLFSELRECLSTGDLFTEGGKAIDPNLPFINDDTQGYLHPFAKPYIIGYALLGLPELAQLKPKEPKLHDVVRAVADFMARSQDPVGGWRYPHPQSRYMIVSQGIEHAAQITRAAAYLESRKEPVENLLDAIERVLQCRVLSWQKTGMIFNGLGGWEDTAGIFKNGKTVADLYKKPDDRDPSRDYTEGAIGIGGAPPEGIVYYWEVMEFYLAHRSAARLFKATPQLKSVLGRMKAK